jgi:hypothetical protein
MRDPAAIDLHDNKHQAIACPLARLDRRDVVLALPRASPPGGASKHVSQPSPALSQPASDPLPFPLEPFLPSTSSALLKVRETTNYSLRVLEFK